MRKGSKWTKEDEELLKQCFFDFLKQEHEFDGPFEFDEELGDAPRSECIWDGNEWICKED